MSVGAKSNKTDSKVSVWGPQSGYLQDLYQQGQNRFNIDGNQQALDLGQQGLNQIGNLYGQASSYYPNLVTGGQAGQIDVTDPTQQYLSQTLQGQGQGMETLTDLQQGGINPNLQGMVGAATRGLTENYQQQVMPGIRQNAAFSGGLGGSRQGVAEGIASQSYLNNIQDTASNIYGQAYDADQQRRLSAAQGMLSQQAGAGQIASGLMGQQAQTGLGAIGAGNELAQLGMAPSGYANQVYGYGWNPLQQYQGIIGGPVSGQQTKTRGYGVDIGVMPQSPETPVKG